MADHVHVRDGGQVPVVCARQRGGRRREDDVVAMPVEAGETLPAACGFTGRQCCQPRRPQLHLARIARHRKARQPGAVMGRADGDGMVQARLVTLLRPPAAQGQAAHAVAHGHRRLPGAGLQLPDRDLDAVRELVDATEHGFEIDGDHRHVQGRQALQPGIPQAAVADETVHEQHAAPTAGSGRQVVGPAAASEGLPPAEDSRRGERLAPPRLQQLGGAGAGCRVVAVQAAEQREFRGQDECVAASDDGRAGQGPAWPAGVHPVQRPRQRRQQGTQGQRLLQAGQHGDVDVGWLEGMDGSVASSRLGPLAAGQLRRRVLARIGIMMSLCHPPSHRWS